MIQIGSVESQINRTGSQMRWLGWAIFLGMSWTWCIGMYLPMLLLRDLGIAGFIVFAIPNVLGAAAMGWTLRTADQSREMVAKHSAACIAFSIVTIAFHVYFAMWIIRPLAGIWTAPLIIAAISVYYLLALRGDKGKIFAATLTLGISTTVIIICLCESAIPHVIPQTTGGALSQSDVLYLAPACLFGFLLCPYLDLTFHQARQAMSAEDSRRGFSIGFGFFFFAMILFTAAYSGWEIVARILCLILAAHFISQSGFTIAVHTQSALSAARSPSKILPALAVAVAISLLLGCVDLGATYHGLTLGEVIYRCFLGFYGIVFPAYVWLCMIRPHRTLTVTAIAVLLALPMFWMAFVEQKMFWLAPGVAVAMLAKLVPSPSQATAD